MMIVLIGYSCTSDVCRKIWFFPPISLVGDTSGGWCVKQVDVMMKFWGKMVCIIHQPMSPPKSGFPTSTGHRTAPPSRSSPAPSWPNKNEGILSKAPMSQWNLDFGWNFGSHPTGGFPSAPRTASPPKGLAPAVPTSRQALRAVKKLKEERGEKIEIKRGSAAVCFFPRWWSWWTWGIDTGGEVELFWGLLWGKLGDAWCCMGMVGSWWLLWFLVFGLDQVWEVQHVQRKRQNLTKHQHNFCVGDLNMNMCCYQHRVPNFWTWRWSWDRFWQKMWLGFSKWLSSRLGKVHLGDGGPWPWTSPLEGQNVWIMFLVMVGEGSAISVHVWWDFDWFWFLSPWQ